MFFRDVTGQDRLKQQLIRTVQKGYIPHARLFCGPAGYGVFPLALAYARYLNCRDRTDTDSCGRCPSCLKYNELVHPDLIFAFPIVKPDKKTEFSCDNFLAEWRDFLKTGAYFDLTSWLNHSKTESKDARIYTNEADMIFRKISMRIFEADYRVVFIWIPERMHPDCANKLLKIIEEPPKNTLVFMVAESTEYMLGTVMSRLQRMNVPPIRTDDLACVAEQQFDVDPAQAQQIAHMAHGDYLKLKEIMQVSEENTRFLELFTAIMRYSWQKDVKAMKGLAEDMSKYSRGKQRRFLAYCQRLVRENFISRFRSDEMNYMNREESEFAVKFAPYVNERNVFGFIDELSEAERHIAQNVNSKMVFFDLALHIAVLLNK
ncbi:MAG: DNA polymerase III subunit delta [Tannerella sp.]|jgi:DNA polymerase-3 subunit delta'|nr:DNA polymerase III subunit delta [Tannerella sp.]